MILDHKMKKMKNSKILFFLLIGLMLGVSSCRNDEDRIIEIIDPNVGIMVEGAVSGQVTDTNGNALASATVSLEGTSITTNENGLYSFGNLELMEGSRVVLKVSRQNYFETSRAFTVTRNRSIVDFELIVKAVVPITFDSSNELEWSFSTDGLISSVNIPADAYVFNGTNTPYNGVVNIFTRFINPADRDRTNSIPGDLGGIDANGEEVQLGSFGMLAVELESPSGEKLNLAEGIEATIRLEIPEEYVDNAPSTIPLWHYDLESATWREEGSANLTTDGSSYEGTVTHFSFWNCDAPFPLITFNGRVTNENGQAQTGVNVRITIIGSGLTRYGQTDSNGEFGGKVPSGERLRIEYFRNFPCAEITNTQEIGPFDNDITLEDHIFSTTDPMFHSLSGRVLDCDGLPSATSYLLLLTPSNGETSITPDNNGNFSIEIPECWTNIVLSAFDYNSGFTTETLFFQNGIAEDIILADLTLCTEDMSFLELNHEGTTYRNEVCTGFFKGDNIFIGTSSRDSFPLAPLDGSISLLNFGTAVLEPGDYVTGRLSFSFIDENGIFHDLTCNSQNPCEINLKIESVGAIGELITGSFSGSVNDTNPDFPGATDISGTFSALRQN
jgi:hypothetical protein